MKTAQRPRPISNDRTQGVVSWSTANDDRGLGALAETGGTVTRSFLATVSPEGEAAQPVPLSKVLATPVVERRDGSLAAASVYVNAARRLVRLAVHENREMSAEDLAAILLLAATMALSTTKSTEAV